MSNAIRNAEFNGSHCQPGSFTDSYGLAIQAVLAGLAFASLILKRFFCEPAGERRSWVVWFFDTSKQAVGAAVIHFLNVFLAQMFQGDPCTWYVVSFLLDSTLGLLIIYAGVRVISRVAVWKGWTTLKFGEYGKPPACRPWVDQCAVFVCIIIIEKIVVTIMLEFRFWRHIREIILSPIPSPKVELTVVMLVIPFFVNTLIFWVVDNFTMRKMLRIGADNPPSTGKNARLHSNHNHMNGNNGRYAKRSYYDDDDESESVERLLVFDEGGEEGAERQTTTNGMATVIPIGDMSDSGETVKLRLNSVSLS